MGRSWRALGRSWDALGRSWDALGRPWAPLFDKSHSKTAPKSDFRSTWFDFELISVPPTIAFYEFFAQMGRVARRRAEPHFDSVWASRNEVRRVRAQVKNRRKIDPDTLLARVAQQVACERRFFQVWTPQNGPQELSRAPSEASRGPLGRSWGALGALLGPLGHSQSDLGMLWGRSWSDLGVIMSALGNPWTILDRPRVDFERSGSGFWLSEARF